MDGGLVANRGAITGRRWTAEEDDILYQHYLNNPDDVVQRLDRSRASIHCRAIKLGLTRPQGWTAQEDDLVCRLYHADRAGLRQQLAPRRSLSAIKSRARTLGIAGH